MCADQALRIARGASQGKKNLFFLHMPKYFQLRSVTDEEGGK
jgi:hypothetical protein